MTKVIVKRRDPDNPTPHFGLEVIAELGDHSKYLDNFLKENDLDVDSIEEDHEEMVVNSLFERAYEEKIIGLVEKVVEVLDDNSVLEFGAPDVDILEAPTKIKDLEKSLFHLSINVPFEVIALPLMDQVEKAIKSNIDDGK